MLELMIGSTLGAYVIERELGRGGMGAVYVGVHQLLGQRVAVKVLLPEMSRSPEVVKRFWAEARAASASRHAGIIQIFDLGTAHGSTYIVMELLEGETLGAHLARSGRLELAAALAITRQVASALVAAHAAGVVHRDLKPDNVFLVPDPEIPLGVRTKILDFGISKVAAHHHIAGGGAMTGTGMMLGTPYYMSPEQCRGASNIDHRSDLYSLGCMLFELLTGRLPFLGEVGEIVGAHQHVPPPLLRSFAPAAPRDVERLVAALLAKAADERPPSAAAVVSQIEEIERRVGGRPLAPRGVAAPKDAALTSSQHTTLHGSAGESRRPWRYGARYWLIPVLGAATLAVIALVVQLTDRGDSAPVSPYSSAVAPRSGSDSGTTAGSALAATIGSTDSSAASPPRDAAPPPEVELDSRVTDAAQPAPPGPVGAPVDETSRTSSAGTAVVVKRPPAMPARPTASPPADNRAATAAAVERAEAAAKAGLWDKASKLASEALANDPANVRALVVKGLAACKSGRVDSAEQYLVRLPDTKAAAIRSVCASHKPETASTDSTPAPAPTPTSTPTPTPTPTPARYIDVYVETMPDGATLLIDGKRVGKTPYRGKHLLQDGEVEFQISRVGFEHTRFTASAKKRIARNITLKRIAPGPTP